MDIQGKPSSPRTDSTKSSQVAPTNQAAGPAAPASSQSASLTESGLKIGESYLATVTHKLTNEMRDGQQAQIQRVLLTTANTTLSVLTDIPLEEGELVTVKVADNYTLKLMPVIAENNLPSAQKLATLIARILPYQSSVGAGVASAMQFGQQLANTPPESTSSAILLKNINTLIGQLPNIQQLSDQLTQFTHTLMTAKLTQSSLSTLLAMPVATPSELNIGDLLKNVARTLTLQADLAPSPPLRQALSALAQASPQTILKLLSPALASEVALTPPTLPSTTHRTALQPGLPTGGAHELLSVKLSASDVNALTTSKDIASALATVQKILTNASPDTSNKATSQSTTAPTTTTPPSATKTTNENNLQGSPAGTDKLLPNPEKEIRAWLQTNMMKSHLNASGIGLESRLARTPQSAAGLPPFTQDIKSSLIRLVSQLAPGYLKVNGVIANPAKIPTAIAPDLLQAPFDFPRVHSAASASAAASTELSAGELLKQIAGALNRIQFNQLNSLHQTQSATTDTMNIQTWMIDVPFIVAQDKTQTVQIKIEQYREKQKNKQRVHNELKRQWKVTLGFDFDSLGSMQIQVRCLDDKLSSTIWAERVDTLKILNDEVPKFRQQLLSLGLEVDSIECRRGRVSEKQHVISHNLVDIHT